MWRDRQKNNSGSRNPKNNRLHLVVAIIFLLCTALIYKLFNLQIKQCDWYTALASSQHQVYSQLKPDRGKIFISDLVNDKETLYPLATNKDFAFLYAVPSAIKDPKVMAEKLFEFFDQPNLLNAGANNSASSTASTTASTSATISASSTLVEFEAWKLSQVGESQKDVYIAKYLSKVDKPGDPYEPLVNKLSTDDLINLYAFLSGNKVSDLDLKNEKIVNIQNNNAEVKIEGLGFDLKKYRYYPENNIGSQFLGFVSYIDEDEKGHYGLEEFFNDELFGKFGSLKTERGGSSAVMIVNDREYVKPENGSDLILTIDRAVQFAACEKLSEAVKKHGATGGSVIAVDPKTGAIIAMCSVPDFNPNDYKDAALREFDNPIVSDQYEPGSVFKTITMASALDQGKVSPSTTYNDPGQLMINGWNKPISNSDFSTKGGHGVVDMNFVLENSLNTGAIFAMRTIGAKTFADYVKNFGFGERSGIELGSEANGNINNLLTKKIRDIDAATASFGQGIAVTPLQMVMAYSAIANGGELMKPYLVKEIVRSDGKKDVIMPQTVRRVVSEKTAATILAMLANVVENGHSKRAALNGYYIGGKTGTAQIAENGGYAKGRYIHTFVGIVPIDNPRFVMLTKMDNPKDVTYAEGSVVPLWHDIADFLLKYYQVPKTKQ